MKEDLNPPQPQPIPTTPEEVATNPTETAEVKKEFTLFRGKESIVVTNAEEATKATQEDFYTRGIMVEGELNKSFGINVHKIQREVNVRRLKERFSENKDRDLIYSSEGLDNWSEDVNNYWFNRSEYNQKGHALVGLEKQLLEIINHGTALILHQDPKDMKAIAFMIHSFNSEVEKDSRIPKNFLLDIKEYSEILSKITYKSDGDEVPDSRHPKNTEIREYHPLLEPFRQTLEKLSAEGATELPGWLKQQGEMAGYSAAYQDIPVQFKNWMEKAQKIETDYEAYIKENGIEDAPYLELPVNNAENLTIIDKQIHRRE